MAGLLSCSAMNETVSTIDEIGEGRLAPGSEPGFSEGVLTAPDAGALSPEQKRGVLAAVFCYVLWGCFPLYWKLLGHVDSFEVVAHRIIWCTVATVLTCLVLKVSPIALFKQRRAWKYLVPAALMITVNWSLYIVAVDMNLVIETAIGYYINPLASVLLGVVVFRERLTPIQCIAVAFCAAGIVYFTLGYGRVPWVALVLAFSFGLYGAVKKKAGYPAVQALAFENLVMVLPAIVFAMALAQVTGSHAFAAGLDTASGWMTTLLLVLGGPVTALPLILFARAANAIPLSLLGFIQYLSPTIALITGVFLFGEPFTLAHGVCLGCIWTGLALVSAETMRKTLRR